MVRAKRRQEAEKPPRRDPGGRSRWVRRASALDRVGPLLILTLGGSDGQPHLLADRARRGSPVHYAVANRSFSSSLSG